MIQIDVKDNNHLYITRGDDLLFDLQITDTNDKPYMFNKDDIVTFAIYKNLKEPAVVLENFYAEDGDESIRIQIDSETMKIGELISSPRVYYYEITLNGVSTVQGYSKTGKSILTLLPEGSNIIGAIENGD